MQRTESYTFPTPLDLAEFLIATHQNSIMGCLQSAKEERREPILQVLSPPSPPHLTPSHLSHHSHTSLTP